MMQHTDDAGIRNKSTLTNTGTINILSDRGIANQKEFNMHYFQKYLFNYLSKIIS